MEECFSRSMGGREFALLPWYGTGWNGPVLYKVGRNAGMKPSLWTGVGQSHQNVIEARLKILKILKIQTMAVVSAANRPWFGF